MPEEHEPILFPTNDGNTPRSPLGEGGSARSGRSIGRRDALFLLGGAALSAGGIYLWQNWPQDEPAESTVGNSVASATPPLVRETPVPPTTEYKPGDVIKTPAGELRVGQEWDISLDYAQFTEYTVKNPSKYVVLNIRHAVPSPGSVSVAERLSVSGLDVVDYEEGGRRFTKSKYLPGVNEPIVVEYLEYQNQGGSKYSLADQKSYQVRPAIHTDTQTIKPTVLSSIPIDQGVLAQMEGKQKLFSSPVNPVTVYVTEADRYSTRIRAAEYSKQGNARFVLVPKELYQQEKYEGEAQWQLTRALAKGVISDFSANSHNYEHFHEREAQLVYAYKNWFASARFANGGAGLEDGKAPAYPFIRILDDIDYTPEAKPVASGIRVGRYLEDSLEIFASVVTILHLKQADFLERYKNLDPMYKPYVREVVTAALRVLEAQFSPSQRNGITSLATLP